MRPESECRKPEFSEGCKVRLGDGQEWTFPRPVLSLVPVRKPDGSLGLQRSPAFGVDFQATLDRYLDRMTADEDEGDVLEFLTLRIALAADLLKRNYEIADDRLAELFVMDLDSPETSEMCAELDAVLQGRSPKKPSAVG